MTQVLHGPCVYFVCIPKYTLGIRWPVVPVDHKLSVQPEPTYLTSGFIYRNGWDLLILKSLQLLRWMGATANVTSSLDIPNLSGEIQVWGVHNRLVYFPVVFQTPKKLLQTQAVPTIVWHSDTLPKETTDSHTCSQYEAGPGRSMLLGRKASFPIQVTEAPAPPLLAFPGHPETSLTVTWNSLLCQWCCPESSRTHAACQESLSNGTLCSASFPSC